MQMINNKVEAKLFNSEKSKCFDVLQITTLTISANDDKHYIWYYCHAINFELIA